jgi:hypothetical protein
MSEPYGSGGGYEAGGGGYGQQPGYGQAPGAPGGQPQYGGQYPPQTGPASGGFPAAGGFPGQGGPGGPGTPMPTPSAPRTPQDRLAMTATILTIVGYFCAGAGLLSFILILTVDIGSGTLKFANALVALVTGLGFGGLNFAAGTWLSGLAGKPGGQAGFPR